MSDFLVVASGKSDLLIHFLRSTTYYEYNIFKIRVLEKLCYYVIDLFLCFFFLMTCTNESKHMCFLKCSEYSAHFIDITKAYRYLCFIIDEMIRKISKTYQIHL